MTTTGTETGLADALVRLSHAVQHVFADVSRESALTPQQAQLLCVLAAGRVGMTQLSRVLHLEKSSLTGLVDRVEQRGLVVRARDTDDRRACRITLTPRGARLAREIHSGVTRRLDQMLTGLRATDRRRLAAAIMDVVG